MSKWRQLPQSSSKRAREVKEKTQKNFKCKIPGKVFADKYALRSHANLYTDQYNFNCDLCSYKGKTKKYLMKHKMQRHTSPTGNQCHVCGKKFHYKSRLVSHTWVHTGEKPYECDVCGKAFNSKYSLNNHNFIHRGMKPHECSFCDYACRDGSTLRKHHARHMGTARIHQCILCDKRYSSTSILKEHMAIIHFNLHGKILYCDVCGKGFKWKTSLVNHIQSVHEKSRACSCTLCGLRLTNRGNLSLHMRRHIEIRPYECVHAGCRKSFKSTSELKSHAIIHKPEEQFPCGKCGRLFARCPRRDRHVAMNICEEKYTRSRYGCDLCTLSFHSKRILSAHMKEHSETKQDVDEFAYDKDNIIDKAKGLDR